MRMQFSQESEDGLTRTVYTITAYQRHDEIQIRAESISVQTRASRRHRKWNTTARWPRRREDEWKGVGDIATPSVPDEVLGTAREAVINSIRFVLPGEP